MKELVVISGKGGTGKTSITACFAALAEGAVLADCDVDAADLHLVLEPKIKRTTDFVGGKGAEIDSSLCSRCGKCFELCRFGAVQRLLDVDEIVSVDYRIDPISCEGCGVCAAFCPAGAIRFEDCVNGQWFVSETRFGPMVHAKLGIAQENSGKLVTLIRNEAKAIGEKENKELLIIDGSPGIGCPVIASMTGADLVLIVTEPTRSGQHDLERVAKLAGQLKVGALVCVNKADINPGIADEIEKDAAKHGMKFAGRVRYAEAFTQAQIAKQSIVEYGDSGAAADIRALWETVLSSL